MKRLMPWMAALGAAALLSMSAPAMAQSNPVYVTLSGVPGATKAVLYKPDTGTPHVALVLMHRTSNFLAHIATGEFSKRGFVVLAMNPRSDNNESLVSFENDTLDLAAGVKYLKALPGITKVLLFGHSGGGPATSFYEAVAENGVAFCQNAAKLVKCSSALAGLPKADGIITADAHPGVGIIGVRFMNPAVTNEADPRIGYQRRLDPFNVANGYSPTGSHYSDAFKTNYFAAQSVRMERLIAMAQARQAAIAAGDSPLTDDEPFIVWQGTSAQLRQLDTSIDHQTSQPEKLLKNDGTVSTQIVTSVRVASPTLKTDNYTLSTGTRFLTLASFLSANAVHSTSSMTGIDYCSSNNSTLCNLQNVNIPLLMATMTGWYFLIDNETMFHAATSPDKDFIMVEGAAHGIVPCTACEATPGQYGNVTKNYFDYAAAWINARF